MSVLYGIIQIVLPFEWLENTFMKNAFLALLVAAPLFGMLGNFIVSRGMAFYSDAIGHSALTGVALGIIFGFRDIAAAMVIFSALLGFAIIAVKSRGSAAHDTIIGVFSSIAMALGIVLLSAGGNFSKYQRYLVGDILSIQPNEIAFLFAVAIAITFVWIFFYNQLFLISLHEAIAKSRGIHVFAVEELFAVLTAIVVTLAIRWTGLLVINSLLVLPAASSRLISKNSRTYFLFSILFSLVSSIAGLAASFYLGSSAGAAIVLANAVFFFACLAVKIIRR